MLRVDMSFKLETITSNKIYLQRVLLINYMSLKNLLVFCI